MLPSTGSKRVGRDLVSEGQQKDRPRPGMSRSHGGSTVKCLRVRYIQSEIHVCWGILHNREKGRRL